MRAQFKWLLLLVILILVHWIDTQAQEPVTVSGCPIIKISCPEVTDEFKIIYNAQVSGVNTSVGLTFKWTVSAGVITDGQGTNSITVDTSKAAGLTITATVEVNGLPSQCYKTFSCATAVIRDPVATKIDEYGNITFIEEKRRLNHLAAELRKDPSAQIYILSYAGRRARLGEAQWRANRAERYLIKKRGIDTRRIVTVDGGYKDMPTVELYLVGIGARPPIVSPTVSPNEVQIIGRRRKQSP